MVFVYLFPISQKNSKKAALIHFNSIQTVYSPPLIITKYNIKNNELEGGPSLSSWIHGVRGFSGCLIVLDGLFRSAPARCNSYINQDGGSMKKNQTRSNSVKRVQHSGGGTPDVSRRRLGNLLRNHDNDWPFSMAGTYPLVPITHWSNFDNISN